MANAERRMKDYAQTSIGKPVEEATATGRTTVENAVMMKGSAVRDARSFKPGQLVPISGLYTVVHQNHRAEHQVLAIRGDEFPACRICKGEVRFHPMQVVPYITHDFDLAGPRLPARKRHAKAANGAA